ncbi:MAG: hypothetical protein G01um101438_492 [Parcubacteria group bacterium Gr01-1014_38]|nr:MAG: hypothetical protein G01um101438_492 [Parcubacteria group bacterium Gr01-1014_38]
MSPFSPKTKREHRVVVGRTRGEELDLLRVERRDGQHRLLAAATIPWESGAALGEPLERLLGWHAHEPLVLAVPTPALAGGSVTIGRALPGTGRTALDLRELTLQAHWHAREQLREEAAEFFGCPLEDLAVFREEVRPWQEARGGDGLEATVTTLFQGPTAFGESLLVPPTPARFQSLPPPDVPVCDLVLLPVFLGEIFQKTSEPIGLLVSEESHLTFVVRDGDILRMLRTAPLGSDLLVGTLVRALSCSPREAATLLERADASVLSPEGVRILVRVFRPLFPLFRTIVRLFFAHLPDSEWPVRLVVAGFWPTLLHRLFFHRNPTLYLSRAPRIVQLLPRPVMTPVDPSRLIAARIPATIFALLEQLADIALRRLEHAPAASAVYQPIQERQLRWHAK